MRRNRITHEQVRYQAHLEELDRPFSKYRDVRPSLAAGHLAFERMAQEEVHSSSSVLQLCEIWSMDETSPEEEGTNRTLFKLPSSSLRL